VANKKNPSDAELKARFTTPKDKLPKDQLHAKRIKLVQDQHVQFLKYVRDVIDDGPAKKRLLSACDTVSKFVKAAVCKPDVDPLPAEVPPKKAATVVRDTSEHTAPVAETVTDTPSTPATDPVPPFMPFPAIPAEPGQ
jgi:hypothetical protein